MAQLSTTWTFFEGRWHEGNAPIMGARTHGAWMCSSVFDGGRRFEGVMPDIDMHVARVNASAVHLGLAPVISDAQWLELIAEGVAKFDPAVALYIRPMYWAESGYGGGVMFDPDTTNWCLCIYEAPMPDPTGPEITLSPFRRATHESAPVLAKTGSLYPNNSRALREATNRGFGNALVRDMLGNIAELANANVFMVKDGVVKTPAPNGVFLNGVTRRRVIGLLRADGVEVQECALTYDDFLDADEIFSSGNFLKVAPIRGIDGRELQQGPLYRRARSLYWDFALSR